MEVQGAFEIETAFKGESKEKQVFHLQLTSVD